MKELTLKMPTRVKLYRAVVNMPQLIVGNTYTVKEWVGPHAHVITGINTMVAIHFSRLIPPCPRDSPV